MPVLMRIGEAQTAFVSALQKVRVGKDRSRLNKYRRIASVLHIVDGDFRVLKYRFPKNTVILAQILMVDGQPRALDDPLDGDGFGRAHEDMAVIGV